MDEFDHIVLICITSIFIWKVDSYVKKCDKATINSIFGIIGNEVMLFINTSVLLGE